MRNLLYVAAFLLCTGMYAQEGSNKGNNKKEETTTKTVKVKTDKGTTEKKIKVTTTEEDDIKLKENPDHYENMTVVDRDSKTRTSMSIEYSDDPFYNEEDKTMHQFSYSDNEYIFEPNERGFIISKKAQPQNEMMGKAMMSSQNRVYLVSMGDKNGFGYFKENGVFVVEYYDSESDMMVVKEFSMMMN